MTDVRRLHLNIALYSMFPSCPSLGDTPWNSAQLPEMGLPGKMDRGEDRGFKNYQQGFLQGSLKQKAYFRIAA